MWFLIIIGCLVGLLAAVLLVQQLRHGRSGSPNSPADRGERVSQHRMHMRT